MPKADQLTPRQKQLLGLFAAGELLLKLFAARDLRRRPAELVRGAKPLWGAALLVNLFGPLAYLAWGRRRASAN